MNQKSKTILLVEDEPLLSETLSAYLVKEGYRVLTAADGQTGLDRFLSEAPDMVLLDLMLPRLSGEAVCSAIRQRSRVPIIMLTAKAREDDKIAGLELGADDYLTKPFSPRELVARVSSLFRRCSADATPLYDTMVWADGDLSADFSAHMVYKRGEAVSLTPNEFKLFAAMAKYPNKTFTREELILIAFGPDYDGYDRTIDSHIKNLRSKIETDSASPRYIKTVRGVGYKFGGTEESA